MAARRSYRQAREQLLKERGPFCAFCGMSGVPRDIDHIMPRAASGTDDLANLQLLCRSCNMRKGARWPREIEFVGYLAQLMDLSPAFSDVRRESPVSDELRYRADLSALRSSSRGTEAVIIECKTAPSFTASRIAALEQQLYNYKKNLRDHVLALAFPGRLTLEQSTSLIGLGVEVWDLDYIASQFSAEIENVQHPFYQALFASVSTPKPGDKERLLLSSLSSCPAGRPSWSRYQQLIGQIIEALFCPPLRKPIPESADATGTNRRDFILPNYAVDGYWSFLRSNYGADYVVADAKNYKGRVKKKEVLQIANYLKPHGVGLFGLIICRTSGDPGCIVTVREQWLSHRKLVLILGDSDVESMLLAKSAGGDPEEILLQKIEEFRLSL